MTKITKRTAKQTATLTKRADRKKNMWKVAKVLIDNPHATEREIVKKAWVSKWTAHSIKKELEKNWAKDTTIEYIIKSSKNRLKKIQLVLDRFVDESLEKEKLDRHDTTLIKDIAKDDLWRITVFWWDITDSWWWLRKSVLDMTDEELLDIINKQ